MKLPKWWRRTLAKVNRSASWRVRYAGRDYASSWTTYTEASFIANRLCATVTTLEWRGDVE